MKLTCKTIGAAALEVEAEPTETVCSPPCQCHFKGLRALH